MIHLYSRLLPFFTAGLLIAGCTSTHNVMAQTAPTPSLKEAYKNDFLIGFAINTPQLSGKDTGALRVIPQQFNAVTPENMMKAEIIQPGMGGLQL